MAAVACLLFGFASIALGIPFFWKQYQVVRDWPPVRAKVVRSEIVETAAGNQKVWSTRVALEYSEGNSIHVVTLNAYRQATNRETVQEAANHFPVGKSVLVRYNPLHSTEIRLDTDNVLRYYQLPIILGATGAAFIFVALGLVAFVRKSS